VLDRIREWLRNARSFRADHEAAWALVRKPDSDSLSPHLGASFSITGRGENYAVVVWKRSMFVGSSSENEMTQKVVELMGRGERSFLFDLRTVGYVGSTGLGALYSLTRSVEEHGGRAVFVFDSTRVMQVIKVVGFDKLLTVVMDYSEAIRILKEGDGGSGSA
jgi:anti-anti-sigma factor